MTWRQRQISGRGLKSEGLKGPRSLRGCAKSRGARQALRGGWNRPGAEKNWPKNAVVSQMTGPATLRRLVLEAYTLAMKGVDDQAAPTTVLPPKADVPGPVADPVSHLTAVYRDYPGLRALIMRRVRDPDVAADILQDAAVTTLEKLRRGEIAHPENVGGFLYRVALNHLRNHRRKDRTGVSSAEELEELRGPEEDADWDRVGRPEWAAAARRLLDEMPSARDRDVLRRFYLNDEDKDQICAALHLSAEHFNRVIFRARNRFRELLEQKGLGKADLLAIVALGLCVSGNGSAILFAAGWNSGPPDDSAYGMEHRA